MKAFAAIFVALAFAAFEAAAASPPRTLSYQGFLTSSAGAPIDTPVQMTFTIYANPAGGSPLWSEVQPSVAVSKGEFSTVLGTVTPLNLAFDAPYYLGVTIGSDAEMTPRQPLAATAYAFRAIALDSAVTLPGSVLTGTIPTATLPGSQVTGSIDTATLPGSQVTGSITTATIPGSQVTGDLNGVNNIVLPNSTASVGNVIKAGIPFIHNFGTNNTFIGAPAGNFTMTGAGGNTAVGTSALVSNTTGFGNTAMGHLALSVNQDGVNNVAAGEYAMAFNTSGSDNVGLGDFALAHNTTGQFNVAIGAGAVQTATIANDNVGVGAFALTSGSGGSNVAIGSSALINSTTGVQNTAVGAHAMNNITTGSVNTALGYQALNASGGSGAVQNVAVGDSTMMNVTTANNNVAVGSQAALGLTTGAFNVAIGSSAMNTNQAGNNNIGIGFSALGGATGSENIGIGFHGGINIGAGSNNIDIGHPGGALDSGVLRIGSGLAQAYISGISGVTTGGAGVAVLVDGTGQLGTISSSRTVKEGIADMGEASALLMKLRPVTFHYRNRPGWPLQYGLIAEEVAEVAPDLAARGADGSIQTVYYQDLPPMLLNEYQKQQHTIEAQRARIEALERRLLQLESKMEIR